MDKKWHDLETLLRRGEHTAVLRGVQELTRGPLNTVARLQAARLYRKAGLPGRALRILGPWPKNERFSELERAEYGAALVNLGAFDEGMKILNKLSVTSHPRIAWIRAAQLIRQWEWAAAIPWLERLPQSEMYLATCLIHGAQDYETASRLLETVLRFRSSEKSEDPRLVRATAWLLLAQSRTLAGAPEEASKALLQSRAALPHSLQSGSTLLFWMIRQWELLVQLRRGKGRSAAVLGELLGEVREGFRALEGWEWARSCALFAAEVHGDTKALEQLYWTTPYPAFRERIRKSGCFGGDGPAPHYALSLGPPSRCSLDIARGISAGSPGKSARLQPLQAKHRLLIALASDFHQPHRIAELHEKVFPQDGYRPEVSADRVHKTIRRLREWLHEHGTELNIVAESGGFSLQSHRGCQLVLSQNPPTASDLGAGPAVDDWVQRARKTFGERPFSASQACERLGGSRRTLARRLRQACSAGLLLSSGRGPATIYRAT